MNITDDECCYLKTSIPIILLKGISKDHFF